MTMCDNALNLKIDDLFTQSLQADPSDTNVPRQVVGAHFSYVDPVQPKDPKIIVANEKVAKLLGIPKDELDKEDFSKIFSGAKKLTNTHPYAMCYGGHQFGNWAGQLGDGRAINLFEVVNDDKRWQVQLKGAGRTPYSRSADGLAVLRSSIREYLMSEAMHNLRIPTTRALSLSLSGDRVMRDMMYDGNAAYEPGAIVCRVAESFIRFGNFQILAARQDIDLLKQLTDYTITTFFPELGPPSKQCYIEFYRKVMKQTVRMIIEWQRVGFVHGVMNTDNMSILGLSIDYGPYGWLDNFDPDWTPNTTDAQNRRYRYAHQPYIGQWNLAQLGNALFPLIEDKDALISVLNEYQTEFEHLNLDMMRAKLGLINEVAEDLELIQDLIDLLPLAEIDMTLFYRNLSKYLKSDVIIPTDGNELLLPIVESFYAWGSLPKETLHRWTGWIHKYLIRLNQEESSDEVRQLKMNQVNPKYVLRNYMAQMAIDQAEKGDYSLIYELEQMLQKPYEDQPEYEKWFAKRPDWARDKIGCSALSCSS